MTDAPPTSLAQLLTAVGQASMRGLWVAAPGEIVSFDAATQMASVQELVAVYSEGEFGDETTQAPAVISQVPVVFPGGDTYPVQPGDGVLLVFSSRSLNEWRELGGSVVTKDARSGHLHDAIAIHGLRAKPHVLPSTAFAGGARIVNGDDIRLGDAASDDPVARKSDLQTFWNVLKAALTGATIALGAGGAGAVPTAVEANPAFAGWPVCSSKVKVD